jgi:hypothetical protein
MLLKKKIQQLLEATSKALILHTNYNLILMQKESPEPEIRSRDQRAQSTQNTNTTAHH